MARLQTAPTTPAARSAQDVHFEEECVEMFSGFLHVLGVPRSIGAIYGMLFASAEPLCFADLVARLEASKGSVSQGLAFLRQSGAVQVVVVPGDRREFFEPELSLRRLASGLIQERIEPLAREAPGALARLRQHAANSQGARRDFQVERIEQLEIWHRQLGRLLPVIQTILKVSRK